FQILRPLADQGNAVAQIYLGAMYRDGKGMAKDYSQAVAWFRKAADQGDFVTPINIAGMYLHGLGVPQDYTQAARWYRRDADKGDDFAQNKLGVMYANGLGGGPGLRAGRRVVPQGRRAGKCARAVPPRQDVQRRQRTGTGLRPGS